MKDNFSIQSKAYSTFRPRFPDQLFQYILSEVKHFDLAWDVATGNGQAAIKLASHFKIVTATDISKNQLAHAEQAPNIIYKIEPAEKSTLENNSVDLIVISQALHWFNLDEFYTEVIRVAKPEAIIAAFVYTLLETEDPAINSLLHDFYFKDTSTWWDPERKLVDQEYKTLPFPFAELTPPVFSMRYFWSLETMCGYIRTWSACQHYEKHFGKNLFDEKLLPLLIPLWPKTSHLEIKFPVFMRIGKVLK